MARAWGLSGRQKLRASTGQQGGGSLILEWFLESAKYFPLTSFPGLTSFVSSGKMSFIIDVALMNCSEKHSVLISLYNEKDSYGGIDAWLWILYLMGGIFIRVVCLF